MTWSADAIQLALIFTLFQIGCQLVRVLYNLLIMGLALATMPLTPSPLVIRSLWRRYAGRAPSIAIIAPAFNEELTVIESVTSLLGQDYPHLEIVVVNDGSRDATLALLIEHFNLVPVERNYNLWVPHAPINGLYGTNVEPRLLVVDKINGGSKADAVNAGINVARSPLVCIIDTDSLIEQDALQRIVRPFITDPNITIATGGAVRVVNGCRVEGSRVVETALPRHQLGRFQSLEYLRAFLLARITLARLGLLTIVSGAFGLFDRRVLLEVGGYSLDTCGEDFELIIKMHRHMREQGVRYQITYLADPICWTMVPDAMNGLASQRRRWQRGEMETLVKHRTMAFNPAYGRIGLVAFPLMLVMDVLAPILALLTYVAVPVFWIVGLLDTVQFLAFVGTSVSFAVLVSVSTLIVEEVEFKRVRDARELAVLALTAVLENLGYRQLNNIWRLRGIYDYLRGRTAWEAIPRAGFGQKA